jgi:hypothetical protein
MAVVPACIVGKEIMDIEKMTPEMIIANEIVSPDHAEARNNQQSQIVDRENPKNSTAIENLEVPFSVPRVIEDAAYQISGKHKEYGDCKERKGLESHQEPEPRRAGMRQQTWGKVVSEED